MAATLDIKGLLKALGFSLENGVQNSWIKKYPNHNNYKIKIDLGKESIDFGGDITIGRKTTSNFKDLENFVVLECVNRLLEKGYKPKSIHLEKTWATGHGTSGILDVLVLRDDGTAYLMIECKTAGVEFDKEFKRVLKDGGQLFTYFQQDKNADVLMLYSSYLDKGKLHYRNEIVKIEDDYRQTGNVKDFYDRWSKLPKNNGVFDSWVKAYDFQSKALTTANLKDIKQEDSSFIFNQFLEILRHNVVSDKPNAFNKIFTLFLCKIYDEKVTKPNDELAFQWFYTPYQYEGISYPPDDNISFQKRLTDLYKKGMKEFLDKSVTDISDADFEKKYGQLDALTKKQILDEFTEIRLKKNNEFAIKEVFNDDSFIENAKVVKEVVELLQGFKIRYTKKQQYLSDFFELLLTTGLKQESGQYFTPVPIAQFIIKSIPLDKIVAEKLEKGEKDNLLPTIIDYAAGSGHFITESMHIVQSIIDKTDPKIYTIDSTAKKISTWKTDHFDWAFQYVYGIEKDYRLVKVGKVGCYLHGDGLAQIIHSDGLGNFAKTDEYKGLLRKSDKDFPKENKQFDIVVSNPPYSVSAFKNNARKYYTEDDFELYDKLTDQSSEIECLFIERTKQLLKDGGIAAIILPKTILSNSGIYTKAREIILQYFDIVAIVELGSNTFMATDTNTVTLFLRRRNNYEPVNTLELVKKAMIDYKDVTINNIENPFSKYLIHSWEGITFSDYVTLLKKVPNNNIESHDLYKEYRKKIKVKSDTEFWNKVLELEQDKIFYFILAYSQKVVLMKTGEKDAEKQFLGYEFSTRRGSEGIHSIQKGKNIEDCTKLFDPHVFDNTLKSSTYIYKAFLGDFDFEIDESLKGNISRSNLIDLLTFDRSEFDKNISVSSKKKVNYEQVWNTTNLTQLGEIAEIKKGTSITQSETIIGSIPVIAGGQEPAYFHNISNREGNIITVSASGAYAGFVNYFETPIFASDCSTIKSIDETKISTKLLYIYLKVIQSEIYHLQRGQAQPHVYGDDLAKIKLPLPSPATQKKIIVEFKEYDKKEAEIHKKIVSLTTKKEEIINNCFSNNKAIELSKFSDVKGGKRVPKELGFSPIKTDYPYIRVTDFKDGSVKTGGLKYIDENVFKKISNYTISSKDVYISIAGTIGLVGIVPIELDGKSLTENAAKIVIKDDAASAKYVYLMLTSSNAQEQIKERTKSVGVPKLAIKRIETIKIPLVKKDEQQKIVSQIDVVENEINTLDKVLLEIVNKKTAILKKYL